MNTAHELPTSSQARREETLLQLLLLAASLACFGPIAVLVAIWSSERWEDISSRGRVFWVGCAGLGIGIYALAWARVMVAYRAGLTLENTATSVVIESWLAAWTYALLLVPAGTLLVLAFRRLAGWFREPTLGDSLAAEEARLAARDRRLGNRAVRQIQAAPTLPKRWLRLGPVIKDDAFPRHGGIRTANRWLAVEESLLDQHLFVLGSTGAGKTETLKRLAAEVLEHTERDIYLVDGKGDSTLAQEFRALAWHHGRGETPVFRLGTGEPSARYDGFRGAKQDVYNRLVEMVGASTPKGQPEGDSEHWKALNRNLLQLICYPEQVGPPRSFEEVRARLDLEWLRHAWRDDLDELAELATYKPRDLDGLRNRLLPLVREFAPLIGPDGFALEETHSAVFSLRTQSAGDTASRLLRFLIEDLKDFAGKRQQRPAIFIIDEFGAFGTTGILSLLALARSAQLGIVLATQDIASLGDETDRRLILANTRTKLLMATDFPEEVASLAGTILRIESSIQHEDGQATKMGSGKIQDAFRISMNEVPRLSAGEAYLIRARRAAKLRIAAVGQIAAAPPERFKPRQAADSNASTASPEPEQDPPDERDDEIIKL